MNISQDFCYTLADKIPDEYLHVIRDSLDIFLKDYEVTRKSTEIQSYVPTIPEEVRKYCICRRIEGASENTIASYELQLKNFFLAVKKTVASITTDDIRVYLGTYKIQRNVQDSTLDAYRICLHSFFEWCLQEDIIPKNPCHKIKPIHYWQEKEDALTDYQIESVRNCCKNKRDLAIVDFLLSTGCRVSELISVKTSDINFKENKLDVIGKGNKKRTVYINGRCAHSLAQYIGEKKDGSEYLFTSLRAPYNKLKKDAVEKMLKLMRPACGVPNLHPHLFRRTMATNALRRGMDITLVQQLLGHESIEVTMRYINISQEDIANSHKRYVA